MPVLFRTTPGKYIHAIGVTSGSWPDRSIPAYLPPMSETWLRSNRRALAFGMIPPVAGAAVGAWIVLTAGEDSGMPRLTLGWGLVGLGAALIVGLAVQLARPRMGYHDGHVLFYLRAGSPVAVPVAVVEAFFLGQGPAHPFLRTGQRGKSVNLIARLAQRETKWSHVAVKPALGRWCDGYVTIRGTWCEPLHIDLVNWLNRRLFEVTAEVRGQMDAEGQPRSTPSPADAQ